MGVVVHCHALTSLPPGESSSTPSTGGWVGPRARLDGSGAAKIPCGYLSSNLNCPACSKLLYILHYPSPLDIC